MEIADKLKFAATLADLGPAVFEDIFVLTRALHERGAQAQRVAEPVAPAPAPRTNAGKGGGQGKGKKAKAPKPDKAAPPPAAPEPQPQAAPESDDVDDALSGLEDLDA